MTLKPNFPGWLQLTFRPRWRECVLPINTHVVIRGIDTTDIPEFLDWSHARRAGLYGPVKRQITLRLDADVVTWFKERAPGERGYQTDINRALREHVDRTSRQETVSAA